MRDMKLIIVDDEPLVRIGIKSAFDWEASGMQIVGEASDGVEALKLIEERKPDAVLLDIKMPRKDGLQVLEELNAKNIRTSVIILSSFDDLTFVKKAMKLGAVDYFHKPAMNAEEIANVLTKLKNELEAGRSPQGEQAEQGDAMRQQHTGTFPHNRLLVHMGAIGQTKLKEGNMYAVQFTVKNYAQVIKRYTKDSESLLSSTIANLLSELLAHEKEAEFLQVQENLFYVFVSVSESKSVQAAFSRVNEIVQVISASLKRFVNVEAVFGVSEAFHSFQEVRQACQQAEQALSERFYRPDDPVLYYRHRPIDDEEALEQVNLYIAGMKNGLIEERYDEFARQLAEWEQYVQETQCLNERDVKKIYEGLLFMLEESGDYLEYRGKIEEIEDFEQLSNMCHAIIDEKIRLRALGSNKEYSPVVRHILQYIETHYDDDISLKQLGERFHVSGNYISRLFKQEVEKGLFDYLNEVRIERAKELLKDYRHKIYEVAEMVGFHSQVHFAIVFNKYVGMSPKEYRKTV